MTPLNEKRRAIRHLLNEHDPADAISIYYAFHHEDNKTSLILDREETNRANGFICFSRTGIDLFRSLVTMRLPADLEEASDLIYKAMPEGADIFISAPATYLPLLSALFTIQKEEHLLIYKLDPGRFEPIINVLVTREDTADGRIGFIIRESTANQSRSESQVVASSWLNWQSHQFAEISVRTQASYRRQGLGQSVVAAAAQHVLNSGRIPLYVVAEHNQASIHLAESLGFINTGAKEVILEATLRLRLQA
jgi:ribosomal protein S18 acetylase RimI-like enzyme